MSYLHRKLEKPLKEAIKKDHQVKKCALLNLRPEKLPFSNGIYAQHWSSV